MRCLSRTPIRVSAVDVANNANVLDEQEWRHQFKEEFGDLKPPLELANTRSNVLWHWRDGKK